MPVVKNSSARRRDIVTRLLTSTTASTPSSAAVRPDPLTRSPRTSVRAPGRRTPGTAPPALAGSGRPRRRRVRTRTSWPRATASATTARPAVPVPPATSSRMRHSRSARCGLLARHRSGRRAVGEKGRLSRGRCPQVSTSSVEQGVEPGVDHLARGVGVVPVDDLAGALLERDRGAEARARGRAAWLLSKTIECALSPSRPRPSRGRPRRSRRRGRARSGPARRRRRRARGDLVPGQHVVGGDVERLADGRAGARAGGRSRGRSPRGGSASTARCRRRGRRPACPGASGRCAVQPPSSGIARPVVGVRGPHDRHREALARGRRRRAGPRRRSCRASTARNGLRSGVDSVTGSRDGGVW